MPCTRSIATSRGTIPIAAVAVAFGCAEPLHVGLGDAQDAALQAALDDAAAQIDAPGATLAVLVPGEGLWTGATGLADVDAGAQMSPDDALAMGSVTKTYTAAVVLQLVDEGALSLDDVAATWAPDAPHASAYTVRHLLAHQTGLDDFVDELAYLAETDRAWSAQELYALVADRELAFPPGTDHAYSNLNYIVLGEVILAVTGRTWGAEVERRLLLPHALAHTWVPSEGAGALTVHGYLGSADVTDAYDPRAPGAGGELLCTAADLARWGAALAAGDVLPPDLTDAMFTVAPPNPDYGLGAYVDDVGGVELVGHSGSTVGYQARLHVHRPTGIAVATLVNDFTAEADVIDVSAWVALGVVPPGG